MVHSTGANNPWLKRYVGPDDGLLGKNQYNNHWNQPMDREVCVHAFIGKLADGTVATYQTLPWDHIDCGVAKGFFLREKANAYGQRVTPDCRIHCNGCGINQITECKLEGIYG